MNRSLLETIEIRKKELESLLPMSAENADRLDTKFRLEFNYNSNHIEGNTLTYGETRMLILHDEVSGQHTYRELEEMKASDLALKMVREMATDDGQSLTEAHIRHLNEILLVEPYWKEAKTADGQPTRVKIIPGDYKQQPNGVETSTGEKIPFPSPQETRILMPELVDWYRAEEEKKELPIVVLAAILHHRFVSIHPFDDGNGRISRLLMNYVFYKNGYPPVVIKTTDKENYIRALREADGGNLDAFIDYIAQQVIWSLDLTIKCAKGEEIEEAEDWKKKLQLLKTELQHKGEITEKRNAQSIEFVLRNVIFPLIRFTDQSLQDVKELFLNAKFALIFAGRAFEIEIGLIPELLLSLSNDIKASHLNVLLNLNDFKKNDFKTFNVIILLRFDFDFYHYALHIADDEILKPVFKKAYHQTLSENEQKQFVSLLANDILKQIRKKIEL